MVADKGYHNGFKRDESARCPHLYPEKKKTGKRHWVGEEINGKWSANRQRLQRPKGNQLLQTWRVDRANIRTILRNRRYPSHTSEKAQ